MDRALLEAVAADHHLSAEVLRDFGARNRYLDDILATFSPQWKSDRDHYRLLCRQIVALAQEGNVILVGRGAAILTQKTTNTFHFRMVAPIHFKVESIALRMGLSKEEAHDLIQTRQQQRDAFLKDFLGQDITDLTLYHLIFNNAKCPVDQIAGVIADVVMPVRPR
jgi:cytidylate kinase